MNTRRFRYVTEQNKLAISVDVEDWYHVPAVSGAPFSPYDSAPEFLESWDKKYDYLTKPTRRTLDILEELGIKATFFVVADVVENYPGLVEEIAEHGHEIGCHGLHHECAIHPDTKESRFTKEEYRDNIAKAKRSLEDASGKEVTGFRAPNAYVGGWMLDVIDDLGFEYDSSVAKNTLYSKTDSNLEGVGTSPYIPAEEQLVPGGENRIVEFPWPYYDLSVVKLPAGGGPVIRMLGSHIVERGIRQSLQRGHSIFYFHPIDIARESFPRVGNLRRRPAYWVGKGETAERRIKKVITNRDPNQCTTCGELSDTIQIETEGIPT
jgi:peptidoglycan/xylan/chitin deacetylase (PgdA/CDA1 family)